MKHNELTYQRIEAYLNEAMSPQEQIAFEAELQQDDELKQTLALHREMEVQYHERDWAFLASRQATDQEAFRRFFESEEARALKEALQEAEKKPAEARVRSLGRRNWILLAAAVVGLMILLIGLWPRSVNPESLYREYAQHNPLQLIEKGAEEDWLNGFESQFNARNYEAVLGMIEQNVQTDTFDYSVQLAIAISYLETDQTTKAKAIFQAISQSDALLNYEGAWYLALTELKAGNIEGAAAKLDAIIASQNHPRQKEALRLRDDL